MRLKTMSEIESVRRRREEREEALAEQDRQRAAIYAEKESAQFGDWKDKEEDFLHHRTKDRSTIRIAEGRMRPVDRIATNMILIEAAKANFENERNLGCSLKGVRVETQSPLDIIGASDAEATQGLVKDSHAFIDFEERRYAKLDASSSNGKKVGDDNDYARMYAARCVDYWRMVATLVEFEIRLGQTSDAPDELHKSALRDLDMTLDDKDEESLVNMKMRVEQQLRGSHKDTDESGSASGCGYFREVLERIEAKITRLRLQTYHDIFLQEARAALGTSTPGEEEQEQEHEHEHEHEEHEHEHERMLSERERDGKIGGRRRRRSHAGWRNYCQKSFLPLARQVPTAQTKVCE